MGFLSASSSFTRFRIVEDVPQELWQQVPQLLERFAFRDIDNTADERSFGWVCFDDMLDTEWNTAPPEKGAYLAFALRLDTRRISAAVFKKHLTIAHNKALEELKEKGKKFLGRDQKKEIREQVRLKLLARSLPIPAIFDVAWNTDTNVIYLASTQSKVVDLFNEYFTETFDLHLEPMTPFFQALAIVGKEGEYRLEQVEAAQFV